MLARDVIESINSLAETRPSVATVDMLLSAKGTSLLTTLDPKTTQKFDDFLKKAVVKVQGARAKALDVVNNKHGDSYSHSIGFRLNDGKGTCFWYYKRDGEGSIAASATAAFPYPTAEFVSFLKSLTLSFTA